MIESLMHQVILALETLEALGVVGGISFVALFLLFSLAFVPASPMTAMAGLLYGPVWGTLMVSLAGIASATLAFTVGRRIARPWVRRRIERSARFSLIDQKVAQEGFRIVLLLRLASIVPFAPLNYTLGASRVEGRDFVTASWLGLLPGTFVYAYMGSLVPDVAQLIGGPTPVSSYEQWLAWGGMIAAFLGLWIVARIASHAISQTG